MQPSPEWEEMAMLISPDNGALLAYCDVYPDCVDIPEPYRATSQPYKIIIWGRYVGETVWRTEHELSHDIEDGQ